MKKFLSLAVVVAALSAVVGCDDKKTTGGSVTKSNTPGAGSGMTTPAGAPPPRPRGGRPSAFLEV
jgi:hypothetical protein